MRYMVVEKFREGARPVYQRASEHGRMLPDGLHFIDSWVDADGLDRCFQLMETDDPTLFDQWMTQWADLVAFEIVPVVTSSEAAERSLA
jgi:hypothetical protein